MHGTQPNIPGRTTGTRALSVILLAVVLFAVPAMAYDWRIRWRTIETEHFYIHYPEDLEEVAQHTANEAERAHEWLAAVMGWEPRAKAHVVVSDDVDASNGSSSENPRRTIRLYASQPGDTGTLDYYGDWTRLLFTHEYTHSIHLDTMYGAPAALRSVFGRIYAANENHPRFMTEGLAVYFETLGTGYGRGASAYGDMLVRMAILEDRFQPIDRWTTFSYSEWPGSNYAYIFGGRLHQWVGEHYGHKFDMVSRLHARQIFPFRYNANMDAVFGRDWNRLVSEFHDDLAARYAAVQEDVEAEGVTLTRQITHTSETTHRPRFSPNGFYLAWREQTRDARPRVMRMDLDTGKVTRLHEARSLGDYDWSPTGRQIVYSRVYPYKVDFDIGDLFLYDTYKRKRYRLTRGARALDPDYSPAANRVVYIHNHNGTTDLAILDVSTRETTYLTHNTPPGPQYSSPRFSPDGKRIAVAVHTDGNRDIYLVDARTSEFKRITEDPAIDRTPVFSADGKTIFFSSDRSGIPNIYAVDLASRELFRVTNVIGGAMEPDVSPDGKLLAFAGYSSRGWDVHLTEIDRSAWKPVPRPRLRVEEASSLGIEEEAREKIDRDDPGPIRVSRAYRPWTSIWPRWWFPIVTTGSDQILVGFESGMSDAASEHAWGLSALYYPESNFAGYSVSYSNAQWYPTITLRNSLSQAYLGRIIKTGGSTKDKYFEHRYTGSLDMYFPITHELYVSAGYRAQYRDPLVHIPASQGEPPDTGWFSGVSATVAFDNAEAYGRSISAERGGRYSATASVDDALFGSDFDVRTYTVSLSHYVGIPRIHHAFAFRAEGGYAEGDDLRGQTFRLGGYSGFFPFNLSQPESFRLRGYEPGAFRGERFAAGSIEYRFPIWRIERGIGTLPIFFDTLTGEVFGDAGHAWTDEWDPDVDGVNPSAGAEVALSMVFAFRHSISLRTGIAQGSAEDGVLAWHVTLGSSF